LRSWLYLLYEFSDKQGKINLKKNLEILSVLSSLPNINH